MDGNNSVSFVQFEGPMATAKRDRSSSHPRGRKRASTKSNQSAVQEQHRAETKISANFEIAKIRQRKQPRISVRNIRGKADDPNANCHSDVLGVIQSGNEIMGSPKVFVVYWDAWYNSRPDVVQRMNQCISDLISGPYMDGLGQYLVGPGEFIGSVVVDSTVDIPPNPMSEGHLEWHIFNWVNNKVIPFTGDLNTLFVVFTPNGVVLTLDGNQSGPGGSMGAYHDAMTVNPPLNWGKNNLFFAAIPSEVFPPTAPSSSAVILRSVSVTHEMVEAFTDRNTNGWLAANGCEIADLCEAAPNNMAGSVSFNGWQAARYWSNEASSCSPLQGVPLAFVAIYDNSQFDGNGVPPAISGKMTELKNEGHTLSKVVLAPDGGWIIICDDTYWNEGFPKAAYETIDQICDHGGTLANVVFDPQGNWALIFNDINFEQGNSGVSGNWYFGPNFAPNVVAFVQLQNSPLIDIDFAPNGAALVINANNNFNPIVTLPNIFPVEAMSEIGVQTGTGRVLTGVTFAPNWEWVLNFEDETPDLSPLFPADVNSILIELATNVGEPNPTNAVPGPGFRSLTFFPP